jgi:hypothetical protein
MLIEIPEDFRHLLKFEVQHLEEPQFIFPGGVAVPDTGGKGD